MYGLAYPHGSELTFGRAKAHKSELLKRMEVASDSNNLPRLLDATIMTKEGSHGLVARQG